MVIFQISTFQSSIFALFGPIREAFGSFKAISRKIFTIGDDCYVSLRMTTLVMQDSKYAPFKVGSLLMALISIQSHPAKYSEGFDAPQTLERSGSEHRRAVTSLIPMVGILGLGIGEGPSSWGFCPLQGEEGTEKGALGEPKGS
jgi:hypothetical protein